jgi:hypothetical protein
LSIYKHKLDKFPKPKRNPRDALFVYADGLTSENIAFQQQYANAKKKRSLNGLSESETLSLVKAAKSPTRSKPTIIEREPDVLGGFELVDPPPMQRAAPGAAGCFTVVQFREWSDEYRIRTRTETSNVAPPLPEGGRKSLSLTMRAAKKIADACDYTARKKGGFKTFLTLTFSKEQRQRIEAEETTIQREISRFCDGITKMYKRGWQMPSGAQAELPHDDEFLYCWVAEVPENEQGEPNPHVHMLLNWRVNYHLFDAWALRIEKLWGMGFAHLEKIKDATAAAAYMMKAAGYLCKAQGKDDQGEVRGNRYGMSAAARAPEWETISETQLHIMGKLIADVEQHMSEKYGHLYNGRRALKKKVDSLPKGSTLRYAAGRTLAKIREQIKPLPIIASKYQIILKGRAAFERFWSWAVAHASINNDWLPDKGPGESYQPGGRPDTLWYAQFKAIHYRRRAERKIRTICETEWVSLQEAPIPIDALEFCQ